MHESTRQIISKEASEWFVANREDAPSGRDSAAFWQWLRTSPLHVEEYLAVTQLACDLRGARATMAANGTEELIRQAAADQADITAPASFFRPTNPRPRTGRWLALAATAGALALVIVFLRLHDVDSRVERYATGHGQQTTYWLGDRSILRLNTDTAVVVRYGAAERVVELIHGQAMFDVTHNSGRPFRVTAGSVQITDLGTALEVYRQAYSTRITVLDGAVNVSHPKDAGTVAHPVWSVRVQAGEQVLTKDAVLAAGPRSVDVVRSTAWLRRRIAFDEEPLSQVAAEFNRYNPLPIVIETPALRSLAVSGVFANDDTESFIAFLRSLEGVKVEVTSAAIAVRSR